MRLAHRALVVLVVVASVAPSAAASAAAASWCAFAGGIATVTFQPGDQLTIGRSGDAIVVDGAPCAMATVTTTDLVRVMPQDTTASAAESVIIDLSDGPLAPGATDEGDGSSEIEIAVELDGAPLGSNDLVRIIGSSDADEMVVDDRAVNLDATEDTDDHDVEILGNGMLEVLGDGGDDVLSIARWGGTALEKVLVGGEGRDRLTGDLGTSTLDGGPGRDVADYSSATFDLSVVWSVDGSAVFDPAYLREDHLAAVEVAVLTSDDDVAVYEGAATGETVLGAGSDRVIGIDPVGGDPSTRLVRGGSGGFDAVELRSTQAQPLRIKLDPGTITGSWAAVHSGFELLISDGTGDDRFRIPGRGGYPTILGGDGHDVLDLRTASEGISLTLGQDPFGRRRWIHAFQIERVLGSGFADQLLGPASGSAPDPLRFLGRAGRDVLRGGSGADVLRGGSGADEVSGASGPDVLLGGRGNDVVAGGPGIDVCRGGAGVDTVRCER